ncbi:MAG: hypothetical protein VB108_02510 [Anaerolineaceae bacterium]|nr:hypothetical protein [Anaerolineaceae bacterium]
MALHGSRMKALCFVSAFCILAGAACQSTAQGRPTQGHTPQWPTTQVPTLTATATPPPSSTPTLTTTPKPSNTPFDTATPQATGTPLAPFYATPFAYQDKQGKLVDYAYSAVSDIQARPNGSILSLSGFAAFELVDRGIYRETIKLMDKPLSLYWLRVRHCFGEEEREVRLILTGLWGINVPFNEAGADGSAYISFAELKASGVFDPKAMHSPWQSGLAKRAPIYRTISLTELESILEKLPQKSLILAESPLLLPPDSWHQVKLNMDTVSSQAARFHWLFRVNDFKIVEGQSESADLWADVLLKGSELPKNMESPINFAADNLVVVRP